METLRNVNDTSGLDNYKYFELINECNPFIVGGDCNSFYLKVYKNESDLENNIFKEVEFYNSQDYVGYVMGMEDITE
jgi:hypothetical protein